MQPTMTFDHGLTVTRNGAEIDLVLTIRATRGQSAHRVAGGGWNPPEPDEYEVIAAHESGTGWTVALTDAEYEEVCFRLAPQWAEEVSCG
jgi:hypothetical protein